MKTARAANITVSMTGMKGGVVVNKLPATPGGVRMFVAVKGPAVTRPPKETGAAPAAAWVAFALAQAAAKQPT